jgi:hypothetical protein
VVAETKIPVSDLPEVKEPVTAAAETKIPVTAPTEVKGPVINQSVTAVTAQEEIKIPAAANEQPGFDQKISGRQEKEISAPEEVQPLKDIQPPKDVVVEKELAPAVTIPEEKSEPVNTKATIVVKPLRQKKDPRQPGEVTILENSNKKRSVPVEKKALPEEVETDLRDIPAVDIDNKRLAVEDIYKERLAAGAKWFIDGKADTYTVQLMVLESGQAEENLKQILDSDNYRSVADKLFILRPVGTLPTVKLFFGEYTTLAAARKARNTLPVFLREYQPFAVSVSDAVEGTR